MAEKRFHQKYSQSWLGSHISAIRPSDGVFIRGLASLTPLQAMSRQTNDELNLDELKGASGGFSHHANIDRLKKSTFIRSQQSAVGSLRLIQSWGPEIQTAAETRYPNPQK